jgi:hypothetical protein
VTQNARSLGHSVPFYNVASAYAARHHFKQNFVFADFGRGNFLDADIVVVVVDGGKQSFFTKKKKAGLSFAFFYLIE